MSTNEKPVTPGQTKSDLTAAVTETRIKELTNVNRIVVNAVNLINDVEIKGAHAQPVTEILGWLVGFSQSLLGQIKTLQSTLPKVEEKPTKADDNGSKIPEPPAPDVAPEDLKSSNDSRAVPVVEGHRHATPGSVDVKVPGPNKPPRVGVVTPRVECSDSAIPRAPQAIRTGDSSTK